MEFKTEIIVRYAETDQMGIVHHSVYPVWFEVGRNECMKAMNMNYSDLEKEGFMLPLSGFDCHYHIPAHFEDRLCIKTKVSRVTPSRVVFSYSVFKGDTLLAEGHSTHGFVEKLTFRPVSMKKKKPELFRILGEVAER